MKARKRVTARGKAYTLKASAGRAKARRGLPEDLAQFYKPIKKPVTLRLDADIIAWFQRQGRGYQTRINRVLREWMMEDRKRSRA